MVRCSAAHYRVGSMACIHVGHVMFDPQILRSGIALACDTQEVRLDDLLVPSGPRVYETIKLEGERINMNHLEEGKCQH